VNGELAPEAQAAAEPAFEPLAWEAIGRYLEEHLPDYSDWFNEWHDRRNEMKGARGSI
jgi:hypothetical protein